MVNIIYFYLQQYDQKNIRRRVYDALNVLMAMNIISKEKKEIRWLGLPTNSLQECNNLEKDKQRRIERIKLKTQQLHDLILQVSYIFCYVLWKQKPNFVPLSRVKCRVNRQNNGNTRWYRNRTVCVGCTERTLVVSSTILLFVYAV